MKFTSRKYGVEIEITDQNVTTDGIAQALRNAGISANAEFYNHETRPTWKVTTDSSCGYEIVSPVLEGENGLDQIKVVCKVLKEMNAVVNKKCGLHVHVDARDLTASEIAKVTAQYARYEKLFDSLVPESRRGTNNDYAQTMKNLLNLDDLSKKMFSTNPIRYAENNVNRYRKVNLHSYARHGTIEFRQHSGTIEAEKIINWVVLLVGFVELKRNGKLRFDAVPELSLQKAIRVFRSADGGSDQEIVKNCFKWMVKRFAELNPTLTKETLLERR